jgi:hypothetical protein
MISVSTWVERILDRTIEKRVVKVGVRHPLTTIERHVRPISEDKLVPFTKLTTLYNTIDNKSILCI